MSPSPTLQTVAEVEISPKLRRRVAAHLEAYFSLQSAIKALEADADVAKAEILATFEDAGEGHALDAGVTVEGVGRIKMVYPTTSKLDVKKLIAQGVSTAQIERATVTKPGKPYPKLSPPGRDSGSGD